MKKPNSTPSGATPAEWQYLKALPETQRTFILPIVSNPILPGLGGLASSDKRGKIPSVLTNQNGKWCVKALPGWQSHITSEEEIAKWSKQLSMGYGLRTGHDGVMAVDIDIDDPELASYIVSRLAATLDLRPEDIPVRRRANSAHCAVLVQLEKYTGADLPMSKVKAVFPASDVLPSPGMVELLGVGRQMALCGTHPSGSRYTWSKSPFPLLRLPQSCFQEWCHVLVNEYHIEWRKEHDPAHHDPAAPVPGDVPQVALEADWVVAGLKAHGLIRGYNAERHLVYIDCPWHDDHSDAGDVTSTAYCLPSLGHRVGGFVCMHAHCYKNPERSTHNFLLYLAEMYGIKEPAHGGAHRG